MKINGAYIISCLISAASGAAICNYFLQSSYIYQTAKSAHINNVAEAPRSHTYSDTTAINCPPNVLSSTRFFPEQKNKIENPENKKEMTAEIAKTTIDNSEEKSKNFSSWINKKIQTSNKFDLRDTMHERFEQETIDAPWAEAQENKYIQLFSQQQTLAGYALTATQCRSTQCELTISITDINQANQLLTDMAAALQAQDQFPLIVSAPDQQQGNTKIYVTYAEHNFESE